MIKQAMPMQSTIIDFHVHAFPDSLAAKAVGALTGGERQMRAHLDGRIDSLLASMNRYRITASVVCSIATKPGQFRPILEWSRQIKSRHIEPLASVHPDDPELFRHLAEVREQGLLGIKIHPYYQNFLLDSKRVIDLLKCARDHDLMVVCHTGYDIAFPREQRADPARLARAFAAVEGLCLVATHGGAWDDWQAAATILNGLPIFRETSFCLGWMPDDRFLNLMATIPEGYLLFGSDSPWNDQGAELDRIRRLKLPRSRERSLIHDNAARLLQQRRRTVTPLA